MNTEYWTAGDMICVDVFICGSCRNYDSPDHWSFALYDPSWKAWFQECGFDSEQEAIEAAKEELKKQAALIIRSTELVQP